ncbi:MAG: histidinol-phosphate transaminase [Bacteroidetes bacterium MedPE-SWsnd-G2]|mgnify:CR=1 FL=1|nr:MAG: histidinol-phosphate transaminase [Bacteroidetes bacterium MedPE-SWsnd-G2]
MEINSLIRGNIKQLKPYASARDEFSFNQDDSILLDANENPFETTVNRYPDPYQLELKKVISKRKSVPIHNMVLGNGSDELIDLILTAFVEPNTDEVILLPPTYGMYKVRAQILGAKLVEVPLKPDFQIDVEGILTKTSENSKVLFICSPNNPSGNLIAATDVEILLKRFPGIVVIDEAYIDFSKQASFWRKSKDYENLIILQTFSKAFGMAGLRLGMAFASSKIVNVLNKIKAPYNINSLTQSYAIKSLVDSENILKKEVNDLLFQRKLLVEELTELKMVLKIYDSETNFLLVKVDDAFKRYNQLKENGIIVRNRSNLMHCNQCLRISIGTEVENKKLVTVLKSKE